MDEGGEDGLSPFAGPSFVLWAFCPPEVKMGEEMAERDLTAAALRREAEEWLYVAAPTTAPIPDVPAPTTAPIPDPLAQACFGQGLGDGLSPAAAPSLVVPVF